ncbi:ATP-binding protein [Maribacter sp. 2307ULW6-5]|uniref:PAS domain-containing sensor histidine kinase n=1 Tax=Maribacter sp. 2307ULW6-5 TaxID=3386275 RepID=UPI0039BD30EC
MAHPISTTQNTLITTDENDRKLRTLIGNLSGIVYSCKNDEQWSMEFMSEGCYAVCGYTPQQFYEGSVDWGSLIAPEDRQTVWDTVQKALSKNESFQVSFRIRTANNETKWILEHGMGVFDDTGKLVRLEGYMQDVTEGIKTHQELKTSEQRNKAILQALPDLVFVFDRKGNYLDVHVSDASQLLAPKDELIGQNIADVLPQRISDKVLAAFVACENSKETQIFEYTLTISEAPKHFEARIVQKENGDFLAITRDITQRKKMELMRIKGAKVLEGVIQLEPLERIGDQIVGIIEKQITNCIATLLQLNAESGTLHKMSAPHLPKTFGKAIEGVAIGPNVGSCGTAAHFKKEIIVSDIAKDPLWAAYRELALADNLRSCWSFPIFSSDQKVLGTFAIYSDIPREPSSAERELILNTISLAGIAIEHHRTTKALTRSKEKLAAYTQELEAKVEERTDELKAMVEKLVESNLSLEDQVQITKTAENSAVASQEMFSAISKNFPHGAIAVVDRQHRITYLDGEELTNFRLKGTDFKGISIDEIALLSEDQKLQIKKDIDKTLDGKHLTFETRYRKNTYGVNTTPLYDNDKQIKHALFVYNNISKQKQIELEILNALEKEQELNELKSSFISMASHEFRTPLSTILSATNLIERQNAPGKEDKRIRYVGSIKSSVKNLVVILNDFLSLSKLEEGKVKAQPSLFDFVDFSNSLVEEIEGIKKNGQVIEVVNNRSSIEVALDPKLMRHITHNLLSNAIKYSEENKTITYKINANDTRLLIAVTDQGIGIPAENQDHLFQRFYRASNVTNIQGTGLGLNIVKQYTELMGGAISFQSKLNEGTTFTVELPLNLITK